MKSFFTRSTMDLLSFFLILLKDMHIKDTLAHRAYIFFKRPLLFLCLCVVIFFFSYYTFGGQNFAVFGEGENVFTLPVGLYSTTLLLSVRLGFSYFSTACCLPRYIRCTVMNFNQGLVMRWIHAPLYTYFLVV